MMKRIIENAHGHPVKDQKFPKIDKVPLCTSCSLQKLIARPSPFKVKNESSMFLERIQVEIVVEHPVAHVHIHNGLAESLIKRLQLIARPLIMRTKLIVSMWGHAILHAASLIRMRPSANHKYSPIQLASGQEPNISHLRIFGYAVFPRVRGVKKNQEKDVTWCELSLLYLDPRTKQCETKIQKRVTKSHIPAANAPARVEIPNKQVGDNIAQEFQKRLKRGRPIGLKDKNPRKRKGIEKHSGHDENVLDETQDIKTSPEEEINDINKEIDIINDDDDPEPKSVIVCQSRPDWGKWKDAMQAELNSLNK
ncbi:hypothetical protein Tco_0545234 [Tanacetum coccineum]